MTTFPFTMKGDGNKDDIENDDDNNDNDDDDDNNDDDANLIITLQPMSPQFSARWK